MKGERGGPDTFGFRFQSHLEAVAPNSIGVAVTVPSELKEAPAQFWANHPLRLPRDCDGPFRLRRQLARRLSAALSRLVSVWKHTWKREDAPRRSALGSRRIG